MEPEIGVRRTHNCDICGKKGYNMFNCPNVAEESSMAVSVVDDSIDGMSGVDDSAEGMSGVDDSADGVNVVDDFVDGNSDCSDVDLEACTSIDMVGDEDLPGECVLLSDESVKGVDQPDGGEP